MGTAALFWAFASTLAAVYVGYPVLLFVLARTRRSSETPAPKDGPLPTVTLFVPAHNEEAVIEAKIRNVLELDYPGDRFEARVVSDGSTDGTCDVARAALESAAPETRKQVRILERPTRTGKTVALSECVPEATADLLIFTDANAMFRPDAVRRLVRHFDDPSVGLVCGRLHYLEGPVGEGLYWRYEDAIKRYEGELGRLLVANGSIYAIRRDLFRPMPGSVADDFVVPLNVASAGYRLVYDPDAIAEEKLPARIEEDFRSKARIVTRGFEAVWRYRSAILRSGPLRIAQYTLHKILRWLAPGLLLALLFVSFQGRQDPVIGTALALQALLYGLAVAGFLMRDRPHVPALARIPLLFCLVNAAAGKGLVDFLRRRQQTVWEKSDSTRRSSCG
jgi:cellulose synthase/poly-beta-1,6-N-acetylglucosamine synthase-like glycosyltransferase